MASKRGCFITVEGGEGVGKSTNLAFIQRHLEAAGETVVMTREPGGTPLAERIRDLLVDRAEHRMPDMTELLLMFAARAEHLEHRIRPALAVGHWVVCDRFTDATYAYQGGGRSMDHALIELLEQHVQRDLRPDLTLLLDAPVEVGIQRARARGEQDRFEVEQSDFFERVRESYLAIARREPERVSIVDASRELADVQRSLADILDGFLARHGRGVRV
ncbi:MAG: dTMP kinase [Gammaproteobacteria bacterium]|jgi:dTMP kinase